LVIPRLSPRRAFLSLVAFVFAPAMAIAQGGVVRGVVLDSTGAQLGYSVVSILPEDRRILTDDFGQFIFARLAPGQYHLRAHHLGYLPRDTVVTVGVDSAPRIEIRLTHITVELAEMRVVAPGPCLKPGPPDPDVNLSLAIVFGQLRENADRAIALAAQFPFVFQVERRVLQQMRDGSNRPAGLDTIVLDGRARWTYRRGEVITTIDDHGKRARQLNIPGLVQLADSGFHNAHCFTYGGVEEIKRKPYIRIDFTPDKLIETPDIAGSVWLDPVSYQINRLVMSVTHPEKLEARINDMTVTSSFREIVESIAILDSTEGVTTFEVPRGSPMVRTERQKTVNVVFTRAVPPGAALH
jgi:Carboxypeptidase regulatory-like domain